MERARDIAKNLTTPQEPQKTGFVITKRQTKKAEVIQAVRIERDFRTQELGYAFKPLVVTSFPTKRPPKGELLYERRNGQWKLQLAAHPKYGLPWGQDRLIPIWLATKAKITDSPEIRFDNASEILRLFGLQDDGRTYNRIHDAFLRVFFTSMYWGTEEQHKRAKATYVDRLTIIDKMTLWRLKPGQQQLPGDDFENKIVLNPRWFKEIKDHPIPCVLKVVRELSNSPAALDFYMWVMYRCKTVKDFTAVPLFGPQGLKGQLGVEGYAQKFHFRMVVKRWIDETRQYWPECPARVSRDGDHLELEHRLGIVPRQASLVYEQ